MTKFITRYNYKPTEGLKTDYEKDPSKTYQECKDDCDINILYRKYLSKGFEPPNIKQLEQRYADISNAKTFEELLNIKQDVNLLFDSLPSEIREGCNYDVDTFMEVIGQPHDDKEVKQFQDQIFDKLGMLDRKEVFKEINEVVDQGLVADVDPIKPKENEEIEKK